MTERPVIAITGSKGKTTTKEMVASVLNQQWHVFKSFQNGNCPYFTEKYKTEINATHEAIVLEYGLTKYQPDDIKKSCELIKPNIGIITNIGKEALGCFAGSIKNIAMAKSELIKGMNSNGVLLLNGDDENSKLLEFGGFKGDVIYVGAKTQSVDYRASHLEYTDEGMVFEVALNNHLHIFQIPLWGEHNVINALFAIAIGDRLGLSVAQLKKGLSEFEKPPHRMGVHRVGGVTLIDDTFNVSVEAMKAAIDVLSAVGKGQKIAVLGSIAWLGDYSIHEHRAIGEYLANKNIDYLYTFDDAKKPLGNAEEIGKRAIECGFSADRVLHLSDRKALHKALLTRKIQSTDIYLFKGANGLRMDVSVQYFKNYLHFLDITIQKQSILHRFKKMVEQFPNQVAIHSLNYKWSYQNLNKEINKIANALLQRQIKVKRVVLLMKHDAPMIAAMLAVLKVNALYVPLDKNTSHPRLVKIINDINPDLMIVDCTTFILAKTLFENIPVLIEDELSKDYRECSILCTSESNAYILYTSGTTNHPKGVLQNHLNLLHYNRVYSNSLQIAHFDKVSIMLSFAYDSAVMDIYVALLNGATLYPFSINENGIEPCIQFVKNNSISIFHTTPTVFRVLVHASSFCSDWMSVRMVVLGGEVARKHDFLLYKKFFPDGCRFINGYGPTEATVCMQYVIDKTTEVENEFLPLGYPVKNTEIILLNMGNESGEIVIECPHVALRYWNDEVLSRQKFYYENGKRFYKTGDLGKRLENGMIDYKGRMDHQVKIRGDKIILTEIEEILLRDKRIKGVVVLAEEHNHDLILVAYYVADHVLVFESVDENLIAFQQWPALFVKVTHIPFTANGKVDRKKLFLNEIHRTYSEAHFYF